MRRLLTLVVIAALGTVALVGPSSEAAADTPPASLWTGQTLGSGASLLSPSQQFRLDMQTDGNLVLTLPNAYPAVVKFASGTFGHPGATATLQQDGNFVVYDTSGRPLWWNGVQSPLPSRLDVRDDGSLEQYLADGSSPWAVGQQQFLVTADHALRAGQVLTAAAQEISSPSGRFDLGFTAGTVEVWENESAPEVAWPQSEVWQPVPSVYTNQTVVLAMQTDGNLVAYASGVTPAWSSGTAGSGADRAEVQDDGNLVLYAGSRPVWATGSTPRTLVTTQSMVSGTRWAVLDFGGSHGFSGAMAMQGDGNLVLYNDQGRATWSSRTAGHPGSRLVLQADGNLVVYDPAGTPRWSSGTAGCGRNTILRFEDAGESDGAGLQLRANYHLVWDGSGRRASC